MAGPLRLKDHRKELSSFMQRSAVAAAFIGALALVLVGRLVLLQIIRYDYYLDQALGNRTRLEPIPSTA